QFGRILLDATPPTGGTAPGAPGTTAPGTPVGAATPTGPGAGLPGTGSTMGGVAPALLDTSTVTPLPTTRLIASRTGATSPRATDAGQPRTAPNGVLGATQSHPATTGNAPAGTLARLAGALPFTGLALLWALAAALLLAAA